MSGTSLDGLDMAFCRFWMDEASELRAETEQETRVETRHALSLQTKWTYNIDASACIPYEKKWRTRLQNSPKLSGLDLLLLNSEYGSFVGDQVNGFMLEHKIRPELIASHGHTVFHQPQNKLSFQLGDGAAIYAKTGIPVVCDFRSVDVYLGGQGAPLVPVGDALLFQEYEYCLNLGGIANISFEKDGRRIAFDICGCNLLLNHLAGKAGLEYDNGGKSARSGTIHKPLLDALENMPYYRKNPPKSLDKETMLSEILPLINQFDISTEDSLATLCEHIAFRIAHAIQNTRGTMLITGGGALNSYLVERISTLSGIKCHIPELNIIEYKEALVFAFLGLLRHLGEVNTLSSVTGAARDSIGGAEYGV